MSIRRLAALLLLALALIPAAARAEGIDDYPDGPVVDDGPKASTLRALHHVTVAGVAEALAYVKARRDGRLDVRLGLRGRPGAEATVTVTAAPCARWVPADEAFACRAGARRTTVRLADGALETAELTVAAPPRATDTVLLVARSGAGRELARMTLPGGAWRGAGAGKAVGATLGDDGAGTAAASAEILVTTDRRGRPDATGFARLDNDGERPVRTETTLRRCAALIPACFLATARETVDPGFGLTAEPGTDALAWPRVPGAALTLNAVARPSGRILARATLPWPAHR